MKYDDADIASAKDILTAWLKPGMTVYTALQHVSASGMSRHIAFYIVRNNEIYDITYYVGVVLDLNRSKTGGLVIKGCGMDMGYHTVYSLSRRIFPNNFECVGDKCQSNDHFNGVTPPRPEFKGNMHRSDSGYALAHRWI